MDLNNTKISPGLILLIVVIALLIVFMLYDSKNLPGNSTSEYQNMPPVAITSEEQFLNEMISNHLAEVESSKIIMNKTRNEKLLILAYNIVANKNSEITEMKEWKKNWFKSNYSDLVIITGLETLSGPESDKTFIKDMISRHKRAIMISQQVIQLKPRTEIDSLASNIIKTHNSEIEQMQKMLVDYT